VPDIQTPTTPRGSLRELLHSARATGPTGVAALGLASDAQAQVPIDHLEPNPWQYRSDDPEWVEELSRSIAEKGQIEAITYRTSQDGKKQIIGGHSRWKAFQLLWSKATNDAERARYATILANEKLDVTDEQMAEYAIIDNLVDTARAIARFQEAHQLTLAEVARRFNLEPDRAKRLLALDRTSERIKRAVQVGVMVQLYNDEGKPLVTEPRSDKPGRPRREHRSLDLMQALELASLQAFLERHRPDRAEKKLDHLLTRILEEGWTFRQVQVECKKEKERARQAADAVAARDGEDGDGSSQDGAEADAAGRVRAPRPLFRCDEKQLLVYLGRLSAATVEQRGELRAELTAVLEQL
jgi:ParB-like chromosome segregation protein Spo0J